jgi:MFS family permease
MVSFNQLNIVLGISVAFFTNYLILRAGNLDVEWLKQLAIKENNWRWMLGLESVPALLYFVLLFMVPRSPRWLLMKGKNAEAKEVMIKACGSEEAKELTLSIQKSLQAAGGDKVKLRELLAPGLRLVLIIGIVIAITQQITGINSVFFYAPMIFEQTGIGTDASFSQAILVGAVNLVFTVFAIWLVDRIGRKPLLIFGLTGIVLSMFLLSFAFDKASYQLRGQDLENVPGRFDMEQFDKMKNVTYQSDLEFNAALKTAIGEDAFKEYHASYIAQSISINPYMVLYGILGFVASFAISLGPVMWVLFSELFPNKVRGLAISFVGLINSGISFLVQLVFPWEQLNLGNSMTFMIYGIFGALGLVFILFFLPETKGKSLEELEAMLCHGN